MTECITATVFTLSPRHLFDFDAATLAIRPAHRVLQIDGDVPQWNKLKKPGRRHMIVNRTCLCAYSAKRLTAFARSNLRDNRHFILDFPQAHLRINETLDFVDVVK